LVTNCSAMFFGDSRQFLRMEKSIERSLIFLVFAPNVLGAYTSIGNDDWSIRSDEYILSGGACDLEATFSQGRKD
jgi:hypothetical protein